MHRPAHFRRLARGVEPSSPPARALPLTAPRHSLMEIFHNIDLLILILALPVFIALGAPISGYLAAGGAWLIGRIAKSAAERRRATALAHSDRNAALGLTAASMLGRLWVLAGAILIVGLVDERPAGLAAALLAIALVTAYLLSEMIAQLSTGEEI